MSAITVSEARKTLFPLVARVNADRTTVEITSRLGNAVLLSKAEYDALVETAHLLRSPANAQRLVEATEQAERGEWSSHSLIR